MNKIFLTFVGILSLNGLQASGHDFTDLPLKKWKEFHEKGLMVANSDGNLDVQRPIDKAIFVAIRNGACNDLVQPLLTKSWQTSNSKDFNDYMEAEVKAAYRSYSPTVLDYQDRIKYAQKADHRGQLEKDLQEYKDFYK